MVGINIDITERKQIEQELRDRNAELEAVLMQFLPPFGSRTTRSVVCHPLATLPLHCA